MIAGEENRATNLVRIPGRPLEGDRCPPRTMGLSAPILCVALWSRSAWAAAVHRRPRGRVLPPNPGRSNTITR